MIDTSEQEFRISLLRVLKEGDPEEASSLIKNRKLNAVWCDKAVAIYVRSDQNQKAKEIIAWTQKYSDVITWHNCILEYAKNTIKRYLEQRGTESILFGFSGVKDRQTIVDIVETVLPIIEHIKADKRISSPLELEALLQTINATILLGQNETLRELGLILKRYDPIPFEYVRLVLSRLLPADPEITSRLYSEHKEDFQAEILALIAEADINNNPQEAFKRGKALKSRNLTEEERINLVGTLFQIAQMIDCEAIEETSRVVSELLPDNNRLMTVISAAAKLRQGEVQEAKDILESSRDEKDAQWLQLYSFCMLTEGDYDRGIQYLTKVIEMMPSIEIYRILGEAAFKGGFAEKAIEAFETVLAGNPDDIGARAKLAQLYFKVNDDLGAESHLHILWTKEKSNVSFGMNYAACLARQGKIDDAIRVYTTMVEETEKPPAEAVIAVAQLYKVRHQSQEGFVYLKKFKDGFWETPSFLVQYMDFGFNSGNEFEANEAMMQVLRLQNEGKAPHEIMQKKSIDDLLEHHKGWAKRTEILCQNTLQGKMPWLMIESLMNQPLYMGWAIRTQPLVFLCDDSQSRARLSIYSTNGFHAKLVDGRRHLEALGLPQKGSDVVIDLSSLITLHRLNLIDTTKQFFNKIYLSCRYQAHLLEETSRLEFHQLSQITTSQKAKQEVDQGTIIVLADTSNLDGFRYINEYSLDDDPKHYYRLRDVHPLVLHLLTKQQSSMLARVCCKPSSIDDKHPPLEHGDNVIIDYNTLKTLINIDVYDIFRNTFRLHITSLDKRTLDADINTISWQENIQKWNDDLRGNINRQFDLIAPNYADETDQDIVLDSYYIAKTKNLSLMADDRVLQVIALNDSEFKGIVFGVDGLLKAFEQEKQMPEDKIADVFMQLIKWRYRFIMPTVNMLLHLMGRYETNNSGKELICIARYVHDCMRDPGLFSGLENTDPPIPMCVKLYHEWLDLSIRFLIALWKDKNISSEKARAITQWTTKELFPSPPKAMIPKGMNMINVVSDLIFKKALTELAFLNDPGRAKESIVELKRNFGLSEEKFLKLFTDFMDLAEKTDV